MTNFEKYRLIIRKEDADYWACKTHKIRAGQKYCDKKCAICIIKSLKWLIEKCE